MRHVARQAVLALLEELHARGMPASRICFQDWMRAYGALYGDRFLHPGLQETEALRSLYEVPEGTDHHELLFCVHTCVALLMKSIAARRGIPVCAEDHLFVWSNHELNATAADLHEPQPGRDLFKPLYQSLLPRQVRHAFGEYYTPEWLAEFVLDETGYHGDTRTRLLDPSCGTGTFLVLAIDRARKRAAARGETAGETAKHILENIHGFELNPLATLAARLNYLLALGDLLLETPPAAPPVRLVDSILNPQMGERFDVLAGNPPWVRWDYLPEEYRAATLPLWKRYGLFSLRGFETRLGAGKKDLSMLFTYAAADHYLKSGGTLGFLITQEVFKSKGAGEGFRRFRLGEQGEPLRVLRAHDFTGLQPFEGATNKTAVIILRKGEETSYPVPYFVWERKAGLQKTALLAQPLGPHCGAWQTVPEGGGSFRLHGSNPYRAMLGANANPYGVFWVEVKQILPGGEVRIRNLPERGKQRIDAVETVIEGDLIYPALRGSDITRWGTTPALHVLAVQDPRTRRGYTEDVMRERWPRTLAYLSRFRNELLSRALYRKYHRDGGHPFYSQFNIADETFSPYKVVWKRMSNDLTAAVISQWKGPLGWKTIVPLETTAFISTSDEREAHFLCGILNSAPVRTFVKSFSSAGRGFGTPSVIRHLRIPGFDEQDPLHQELARLSRELHWRRGNGVSEGVEELESRIDAAILSPDF